VVFPLVVLFFFKLPFFATGLFGAAVFARFLAIARFCGRFFAGVAFLPAAFFDFFLFFFLLAIREV
jgi:hypothetical protein